MIYYLVTTDRDAEVFQRLSEGKVPEGKIEVIGEGAAELRRYKEEDVLVHIGYARGFKIDSGRIVEPVYVVDMQTREVIRADAIFPIEHRICFTADEEMDAPESDYAVVCDKELFKIMSTKHKRAHALKIVKGDSDGSEYEEQWKEAIRLIGKFVRE